MSKDFRYRDEEWLREQRAGLLKPSWQIATECGVDRTTIDNWIRKFNIRIHIKDAEYKKFRYRSEEWLRRQCVDLRKTPRQIASECGISVSSLNDWISKYHLNARIKEIKYEDGKHRNRGWLYKQYVELRKSKEQIADECTASAKTVGDWIHRHGLDVYIKEIEREEIQYKNKAWLREQYVELERGLINIGAECGVSGTTISN